jgi:hypothetical protein
VGDGKFASERSYRSLSRSKELQEQGPSVEIGKVTIYLSTIIKQCWSTGLMQTDTKKSTDNNTSSHLDSTFTICKVFLLTFSHLSL